MHLAAHRLGTQQENLVLSGLAIAFNYTSGWLIWSITFFIAILRAIRARLDVLSYIAKVDIVNCLSFWRVKQERRKATMASLRSLYMVGGFTVTLAWFSSLLMGFREHLFVWSVFAPKFFYILYACIFFEIVFLFYFILFYIWSK